MFSNRRKTAQVEINNRLIPILPVQEGDDGKMDVSTLQMVTGLLPIAGVMQRDDGHLIPTVFLRLDSRGNDGKEVSQTYSFHPMALATAANMLSAISLMILADPDPLVKEAAETAGLDMKPKPARHTHNGYL